ncbi:MAG: ABC transporter ATP-binding protein [Longimicrobiales bacterium]
MIRVTDLEKAYGSKRVLGPIGFEVGRGETLGVLGRNGAGKTTLLRILAGDLRPSAGSVSIDGVDAVQNPRAARGRIGYLPEVPPIYEAMRVHDFLVFAGRLRGVAPVALPDRVAEVEALTQIDHVRDELIGHLSHGYRQRVGVAQSILHDPPLLILDEPTHDLDPVQIVEMRTLIRALKGKHTVILSSHILPEIREVCDRLLVVNAGRAAATGTEAELAGRFLGSRRLRVTARAAAGGAAGEDDAADRLTECLRGVDGVTAVALAGREDGMLAFRVDTRGDCRAEVCRALVTAGHDVLGLERAERELENVFLELVGGEYGVARD